MSRLQQTGRFLGSKPLLLALLLAAGLHLLVLLGYPEPDDQEASLEQAFREATEIQLDMLELPEPALEPLPEAQVEPEPPALESLPENQVASEAPALEPLPESPIEPEPQAEPELQAEPEPPPQAHGSLIARSREMARLEAKFANQQALSQQRPRIRRISAGAPMTSEEAFYLQQWEARVERMGNLNYPEEARRQDLQGRLRLLVSINADGSLREAQLLTSSGHRVLDTAALDILHLAAPFPPFPEALRAETEVLEIVRTWRFGSSWRAN